MDDLVIRNMAFEIQSFLENENLSDVKPKQLMALLIEKGYFKKDHRDGLPLRELLRDLYATNRLHLLPQVRADRKQANIYWYFNPVTSDFASTIIKYLDKNQIPFNRYKSWNHCHEAFSMLKDSKILSLHLGFYLASWGMYRGSSKLLQRDYLIHEGAVDIISKFENLRSSQKREVKREDIPLILNLIDALREHYFSILDVQPSDTLISKVILGTLGCLPAFDRYFCNGVKVKNLDFRSLTRKSLDNLLTYMEEKGDELKKFQNHRKIYYPNMKLVDMYFYQIGYEMNKK